MTATPKGRITVPLVTSPQPVRWQRLVQAQDGVLSRRQALLHGLGEEGWQWRLSLGRWQSLLPGVAAAHNGAVTARQRAWAAVLYAGEGGALAGDAALVAAGLDVPEPRTYDVAVPARRQVRAQRGRGDGPRVVVHRLVRLPDLVTPSLGPPRVRPAPAVLQAATWAPTDRAAEWRVAVAVQQGVVTVPELRSAWGRETGRQELLRRLFDEVEFGAHALSELDFLRLVHRNGLPDPDRCQLAVRAGGRVRYLDAWWGKPRVAAEIDGAHHRSVTAWSADVLRANDVSVRSGADRVLLLRYTTGNLRHDEPVVVAQLRAALTGPGM